MAAVLSTPIIRPSTTKLQLGVLDYSVVGENPSSGISIFAGLNSLNGKKKQKKDLCISFSVKGCQSAIQNSNVKHWKNTRKGNGKMLLSEGRDGDENYGPVCPGCGVIMQDEDPNLPGYYKARKMEIEAVSEGEEDAFEELDEEDEGEGFVDDILGDYEVDDDDDEGGGKSISEDEIDWDMKEWELLFENEDDKLKEMDGFSQAGVGYGNITEETLDRQKKQKVSKAERKRLAREAQREKEEVTVCARCYSLRNYGQVKNQMAENLIPDFDFDRLITTRLMKPMGNADSTVVLMVVDCVDFDGSFPKRAAKSLFKALEGSADGSKSSKKLPRLVLVATKVDLLPSQVSPTRLDRWIRHRAKANGAPKLNGVYLVSAHKDLGVRNLSSFIKEMAGPRGHVWVIGAQNAGKSTLINAFAKKEGVKFTKLTEAAVPGTTLGILRIGGILPAKAKMYDTPGLLHPYLMSMRLNREEQKMIEIRKELKPRTYRVKQGQTLHVGGLARLDLMKASVETIYITIWASPSISLHLGKIESAEEIWNKHVGVRLQPPVSTDRVYELGNWKCQEFKVTGASWDVKSIDIAVAGMGWFSLGLKGEALLSLWTYDGVDVTTREPLVLDRAAFLERPGFWLPKAISEAIGNQSKLEARKGNKSHEDDITSLSEISA